MLSADCRNRLQWFRMETARCASPSLLGAPLLTCASSCDASNAWPLGPAAFVREVRKKRTMTYGPIWSQKWWEMVPDTHLQKSHGPMSDEKWSQHVSECRYQSTDLSTRSIDHGRYRRSIRIHLQRITVDRGWWIKIRDNFVVDLIDDTCEKKVISYTNKLNLGCHLKDFLPLDTHFQFSIKTLLSTNRNPLFCIFGPF